MGDEEGDGEDFLAPEADYREGEEDQKERGPRHRSKKKRAKRDDIDRHIQALKEGRSGVHYSSAEELPSHINPRLGHWEGEPKATSLRDLKEARREFRAARDWLEQEHGWQINENHDITRWALVNISNDKTKKIVADIKDKKRKREEEGERALARLEADSILSARDSAEDERKVIALARGLVAASSSNLSAFQLGGRLK